MLLLFLLSLDIDNQIDSLKNELTHHVQFSTIVELNECYLLTDRFDHATELLRKYYDRLNQTDNTALCLLLGDVHLYSGNIVAARDEYLKLVHRNPRSELANDALEKLLMIEARKDTTTLKKLAYALCLYYTARLESAQESLRTIIKTKQGDYAYYFMSLVYMKENNMAQALSALNELKKNFPNTDITNATILEAEIYVKIGLEKNARKILEDLIVQQPNSVYAVRAKALLKELSQ